MRLAICWRLITECPLRLAYSAQTMKKQVKPLPSGPVLYNPVLYRPALFCPCLAFLFALRSPFDFTFFAAIAPSAALCAKRGEIYLLVLIGLL